ncbi:MAG: hypothetical protein PUP93_25385 [Rhizonema sp. NSF051]|nr:hypothetical protein [Rhizonema sp. NSF051]
MADDGHFLTGITLRNVVGGFLHWGIGEVRGGRRGNWQCRSWGSRGDFLIGVCPKIPPHWRNQVFKNF